MRRYTERLRRYLAGTPRLFAVPLAVLLLSLLLVTTVFGQDVVTVVDTAGGTHRLLTTSRQPDEIIEMVGLSTTVHDEVVYTENPDNSASILIRRAFPVALLADGIQLDAQVVDGTVADLIEHCDVEMGPEDFTSPSPQTPLEEGLVAKVHRVSYAEETAREEVSDEEVATYVESLPVGEDGEPDFQKSNAGIYDVTYRHKLVDGEVVETDIVELIPFIRPREPGNTAFVPGVPCSRIEGFEGVEMGPDGLPVNYTRVMNGAVATAYSSSGGRGASGLGLYCGTVAVNPHVIPYGTRLFITSADGSFVYGFAIATDTGTAMMEGRVDIDLFFETNAECLRFGKRALDVYILD